MVIRNVFIIVGEVSFIDDRVMCWQFGSLGDNSFKCKYKIGFNCIELYKILV